MKTRFIKFAVLFAAIFIIVSDSNAQYRRYPRAYHRNAVSIGIGGIFNFPVRYGYGPNVGISIGVALPPIGVTIYNLPPGSRRVYYDGVPYYYRDDIYYRERNGRDGYEVVQPPLGATVYHIPFTAKKRIIDGQKYYEYDGTFFRKDIDENGEAVYVVVGINGELNTSGIENRRYAEPDENNDGYNNRDEVYDNPRENDVIAKDIDSNDIVRPQIGDQFEQLPKDSRAVAVDGKRMYVSPNGVYYKEITEDGHTMYEVVRIK